MDRQNVDLGYIGHMQPVETVGKLALTGVGVCLPIIMVISAFSALRIYLGATGIFGIQIACQQTFIALGNAKCSLFLAEPVADFLAVCATSTLFFFQLKKAMAALEHRI